jgi:hypothetical protein
MNGTRFGALCALAGCFRLGVVKRDFLVAKCC